MSPSISRATSLVVTGHGTARGPCVVEWLWWKLRGRGNCSFAVASHQSLALGGRVLGRACRSCANAFTVLASTR